jgi:penicillin-binding protein 2
LRFRDHALYTAFAPVDKPRIAIAMIVENGGFGAAGAAPIAKLALDYFLLGKRPDDKAKELIKSMDANPAEKVDASEMESEAAVKAESESEGGPPPGAVTPPTKE